MRQNEECGNEGLHFSFQLRLPATPGFSLICFPSALTSLIFICLFLLDINDVYRLDVFLLKRTKLSQLL